jgi:2-iminobutanoate/2-iminopropanoate deaminase
MNWEVKKYPAQYGTEVQSYTHVSPEEPFLSNSTVVGNLVFLSAMTARSADTGKIEVHTLEEQIIATLENIKTAMEAVGSSLENVIKTVILFNDLDDYPTLRKVETEYYLKHAPALAADPPCSSIFQPNMLLDPECLIEFEVIGVVDKNRPGQELTIYPAIYGGVKFAYPHVPLGHGTFSKSAVVGNIVICSGMAGLALDTWGITSELLEDQMIVSLDKIKMNMEQVGTSMNNIIKVVNLLKRAEEYDRMMEKDMEYYRQHAPALVKDPPAHTYIQCDLHLPKHLIETEVIAVIDSNKPGYEIKNYPLYYGKTREPFARSVTAANMVFTSGIDPRNPDTGIIDSNIAEEQMAVVLDKLRYAMEEAGGSMNDIIKNTVLLKDRRHYPAVRKAEVEYYSKHASGLVKGPPASTVIMPASLTHSQSLVEVEVIGVISA